jgi:uncharacterized delta-60 repeat protein
MPYIIDSITAETINVNQELKVNGQEITTPKYYNIGNSSTNTNIDWSDGVIQEINLDNNPTLTFSNGLLGQTSTLLLKQEQPGLRFITWPDNVIWNGGNQPTMQSITAVTAGSIDTTFDIGTGFTDEPYAIAVQPDDKILVGGEFLSYNGTSLNSLIRLNPDGTIDSTFNVGTGFDAYGAVAAFSIQSDGKIFMGGWFTSYNGTNANRIIKLNSDASIDNTFVYGTGFNSDVWVIETQSDGKILIGGWFTSYNGTSRNRIIRLNLDGSIDSTFNIGSGFSSSVLSLQIQPDGKILAAGFFISYNGTSSGYIVRLNTDGSIDNTFNIGTGFNGYIFNIKLDSDGKIIAGGDFTLYNGTSRNRIIRLNPDGSIDNTFSIGSGFNNYIDKILIQPDGKIIAGGDFTLYNGTSRNRIIRLNPDGSIDSTFNIGTGFNNWISASALQSDNNILIGGNFTSYNGVTKNRIVRLIGEPFVDGIFYNTTNFTYNGTNYIGSY